MASHPVEHESRPPPLRRGGNFLDERREKLGSAWESHIFFTFCFFHHSATFLKWSSFPVQNESTVSETMAQLHTSMSEKSAIRQRVGRLLTEIESWRQWSANNVHSLWRQLLSGVLLYCQNIAIGSACARVCTCVCSSPPLCHPFRRISPLCQPLRSQKAAQRPFLSRGTECGLMGTSLFLQNRM